MNSVDFNVVTSNVNFKGFQWPRQVHFKEPAGPGIIKKTINSSETKEKETAIRKSLEWIFKKLGFGKKLRNAGEETKNKTKKTSNVAKSLKFFKDMKSFEKNPAEYNHNEFENHMKNIFKA